MKYIQDIFYGIIIGDFIMKVLDRVLDRPGRMEYAIVAHYVEVGDDSQYYFVGKSRDPVKVDDIAEALDGGDYFVCEIFNLSTHSGERAFKSMLFLTEENLNTDAYNELMLAKAML